MTRFDWLTALLWLGLTVAALLLSYVLLNALLWLAQAALTWLFGLAVSKPEILIVAIPALCAVVIALDGE